MSSSRLAPQVARIRRAPVLAEAVLFIVTARILLIVAPIDRLLTGERAPGERGLLTSAPGDPRAAVVAQALRSASRRLPGKTTCLARALAGLWMLRRRRLGAVVHLGMRREAAGLAAHAWLESAGGVVCGGEDMGDFTPIARIGTL
jgi:hypothetical protein